MFQKLGVCVDGSEQARFAFETALETALCLKASLLIITVAPPEAPSYMSPPSGPSEETIRRYSSLAHDLMERAQAKGLIDVGMVVLQGDPVDAILDHLDHAPVDALFVGARGLSRTQRIFLGSVSSALSTHAKCSVIVIKPPQGARPKSKTRT